MFLIYYFKSYFFVCVCEGKGYIINWNVSIFTTKVNVNDVKRWNIQNYDCDSTFNVRFLFLKVKSRYSSCFSFFILFARCLFCFYCLLFKSPIYHFSFFFYHLFIYFSASSFVLILLFRLHIFLFCSRD